MQTVNESISAENLAKRIGVSVPTIRRYVENGTFQEGVDYDMYGKQRLFKKSCIAKFQGIIMKNKKSLGANSKTCLVLYVKENSSDIINTQKIESFMSEQNYVPVLNESLSADNFTDEDYKNFADFISENRVAFDGKINSIVKKKVLKILGDVENKLNSAKTTMDKIKQYKHTDSLYNNYIHLKNGGDFNKVENKELRGIFMVLVYDFSDCIVNEIPLEEACKGIKIEKWIKNDKEAKKPKGYDYAEIFNSVLSEYKKLFIAKSYHANNHFILETILKDDEEQFLQMAYNISSKYYSEVYAFNLNLLPERTNDAIKLLKMHVDVNEVVADMDGEYHIKEV